MTTVSKLVTNMSPPVDHAGLTLPLKTSLGSSELAKHKALVALELEIMAKKFDRFGWERDRGSAIQDRLIMDWIDTLADFPLAEIQSACRAAVQHNPDRMPNEGHILKSIVARRAEIRRAQPKSKAQEDIRPLLSEAELAERKRIAEEVMSGFRRMPVSSVE